MSICMPEQFKIVQIGAPTTTNGAITSDYISLKNVHRATIIFNFYNGATHDTDCSLMKATAVAPTGATAVTSTHPIWSNEDTAAGDTLTRQTDAATLVITGAETKGIQVIIQVDPEKLGATYDCIAAKTDASSEATNFVQMTAILEMRYPQATPPTVITD